ncbi:MAG: hypothetical protein IJ899_00250, partial [Blautia sp.]|nr:hypothetical protein [Blautia sp.]
QDVVPLQIIQESPAGEKDARPGGIVRPENIHPERTDNAKSEELKEGFVSVLQVCFPNGISLDISNHVNPSVLRYAISSLAET